MQRIATGPVIVVLALFAAYILYTTTTIALENDGPATFWLSIAVLYVIAGAAAWFAFRLYRIRKNKGSRPLTNG
jgi:hypothetical protein